MKGKKAPSLLKKIEAALSSKTNALRVRIMIFFLLHKNMDRGSLAQSFCHSFQALVAHHPHHHSKKKYEEEDSNAGHQLMYYNQVNGGGPHTESFMANVEEEEDPDLTRVLFKESEAAMEEEEGVAEAEAKEVVEYRWGPEVVKEVVEENVDQAADMFIKRFKRQIQLQKQQSLERHQVLLVSNS